MNNLQFLVVEDNAAEREPVMERIKGWGYKNVEGVRSAESALRFLRGSNAFRFFIYLDLGLPRMNGVDFAEQLHYEFPHKSIYVFLVSGRPDRVLQAIQASLTGGIDAYMPKPVDVELLHNQIEIAKRKLIRDEQLVIQGTKDIMTGVHNRATIQQQLEIEMNRVSHMDDEVRKRREKGEDVLGSHFAVAILDIDNFKDFNNTYGHAAGDAVLKEFAQRVDNSDRSSDELGRWGGDEFLLKAPECSEKNLKTMLKRIKRVVEEEPFEFALPSGERVKVKVTVSSGAAVSTFETREAGEDLEKLIARADSALYRAKEEGRNKVVII